jgi:putative ABC transport system permease protein
MGLALRLALRDFRGGLGSLRLLAVCLFLGVAALAGVGSLSTAILTALTERGQAILGGDIAVSMAQREASAEELAALQGFGTVGKVVRMRAMASRLDAEEAVLTEMKAVDRTYPLYGEVRLKGGKSLRKALVGPGVVVDQAVIDRLRSGVGHAVSVGEATLTITGVLESEPDKVGEGFTFGPTMLMSQETLAVTGLKQPGSLFRTEYRLRLPPGRTPQSVEDALEARFPDAGWRIRQQDNAAPGARRFIDRLGQFLTLVGLTSLLVAGVGVANGVGAYLAGKTGTIAALKTVGADSGTIFRVFLLQVGVVTVFAVLAGAAAGALVPEAVARVAGGVLPVPPEIGFYPLPLLTAVAYGLLAAAAFAVLPLARARKVPAARLFRARVEGARRPPFWAILVVLLSAFVIAGVAALQAREPEFAAMFIAAAVALMVLLAVLAGIIRLLAAHAPHPRRPLARLALANLHRPGAMTGQLVMALGLGLTLFATLAVIESNLSRQIDETLPAEAPSYFVLDIPSADAARFREVVDAAAPGAGVRMVPSLRGPVTAVGGTPVSEMKSIPEGAWVLRGDRGLTYSADVPPGNKVVAGEWWPKDYSGPQLVSMEAEMADLLGLKVGDTLTVSVLGVDLEARIANLRDINWDSLGFNFALVYSPGLIESAPHTYMATIAAPPGRDRELTRAITRNFKSASMIRVKDVLDSVSTLFGQMSAAIRAAASVAIAAGIAVLIGAIAAARRARIYDAVILKVLGATRRQVLVSLLIEYAILAVLVAAIAFGLGTMGGWYVVTQVFELDWLPRWEPVAATVVLGAAATLVLSLVGSWRALGARPAQALRAL